MYKRQGQWFTQGLSPRAGLALLRAAKALALMDGRDYATPDDVQQVAVGVMAHRLISTATSGRGSAEQVQTMMESVALS